MRVSASLRVDGDLRCDTLQCSGSAKIEGALSCAGEVRCSGSVKVAGKAAMQEGRFSGSVKAQSLHCTGTLQCSGSAKTEGGMQLGKARFSGSCAAEGDIHAEELEIAGSLRAPAVEAERFHASGVFRINGLLNAGRHGIGRHVALLAIEDIKAGAVIFHAEPQIAVHHRQLIQVGHHCQVANLIHLAF